MIRNGIDITKCDIRCCDDLIYEEDYINAVYELWFDVETYFDITLDDNGWINLYTNWFPNGDIEVIVEYDTGDKISYLPFEPDEDEKTFFISKMEERCIRLYGENLMEFYEETSKFECDNMHKNKVGLSLGITDKNGYALSIGDTVQYGEYKGILLYNCCYEEYGIFFGMWYGDDKYNPDSYGKFIAVPMDNSDKSEITLVETGGNVNE